MPPPPHRYHPPEPPPRRRWVEAVAVAAVLSVLVATAVALTSHYGPEDRPEERAAPAPRSSTPARTERKATARPRPRPRFVSGRHDHPVPILVYHVINTAPADAAQPDLWVPAEEFAAQMQALARRGYHGVTLTQVLEYWERGLALPRRPIVVTFDDGYASQYHAAAPVLRKLRWPGVVNLKVDALGAPGSLNRTMVRRLVKAGWEVGSRTLSQPDLTTIDDERLRTELVESRRTLRERVGSRVHVLAYPAGRFDARVADAARAAGYRAGLTTQSGLATPADPFALARLPVRPGTAPQALLDMVGSDAAVGAGAGTGTDE